MSQRVQVLFTRADNQNMVSLKEDELKKSLFQSELRLRIRYRSIILNCASYKAALRVFRNKNLEQEMGRTVNPLRQLNQCRPEAQETEETIFK